MSVESSIRCNCPWTPKCMFLNQVFLNVPDQNFKFIVSSVLRLTCRVELSVNFCHVCAFSLILFSSDQGSALKHIVDNRRVPVLVSFKVSDHRVEVRDVVFILMLKGLLEVSFRGINTGLSDGNCGGLRGQSGVAEEVKVIDVDKVFDNDFSVVGLFL